MNILVTFLLSIGLLLLSLPVHADPPAKAGVTRIFIEEGYDNWAADNPVSPGTIFCPGGQFTVANGMPVCDGSKTGRLHFRDSVLWSCMTSYLDAENTEKEERLTGIALVTINGNLDVDFSGPVWGKFKIVPFLECNKDGAYPEQKIEDATSFWSGNWTGQRFKDKVNNIWIGDLKIVGKGIGGDIEGLHFKGQEWIVMYTPFPVPYEFLYEDYPELFNEPEGYFTGTIKE